MYTLSVVSKYKRSDVGWAIKRQREALDVTQRGLAEMAGCTVTTVSMIELGVRGFSWGLLNRLCKSLRISVSALVEMGE